MAYPKPTMIARIRTISKIWFYDIFTKYLAECNRTIFEGMARDGLEST